MPYLAERGQNTAWSGEKAGARTAVDLLTKRHVLGLPWVRPEKREGRPSMRNPSQPLPYRAQMQSRPEAHTAERGLSNGYSSSIT